MELERVDQVRVTTLVENSINPFLKERDGVQRRHPEKGTFLAEHGWAALIETTTGTEKHTLLLDAGLSTTTLLHNMVRLKIDPAPIEALVVSHGHDDHTGAVAAVAQRTKQPLPVYVHPAAFRERWYIPPEGRRRGPWRIKQEDWASDDVKIVKTEESCQIGPGCIVTGSIPRANDFELPPKHYYYRENEAFHPETLPDDQAVVVVVKDKGLVVVSGCAHTGIVNTVHHARAITSEERVWAVIGGFHLARASRECMEATIAELQALRPATVAPGHCTGFGAYCAFAHSMPDQFTLNVVGTVIRTD